MANSDSEPNAHLNVTVGSHTTISNANLVVGSVIHGDVHQYHNQTIPVSDYDISELPASPYPGLHAYTAKASDLYAGREAQIDQACALLTEAGQQRPLLFIVGSSGSGKSSLVQAGIIPALAEYYANQRYAVRHASFTPLSLPRSRFHQAVMHSWQLEYAADWPIRRCIDELRRHTDREQVNLIVIDQFEELWTQSDALQRDELIGALEQLPDFAAARTHVIACLRGDFIGRLFDHTELYQQATAGSRITLRRLDQAELTAAIKRPLRIKHPTKRWEPLLLENIARIAAQHADSLPILQVLIERIWSTGRLCIDQPIDFTRVISDHAQQIYDSLAPDDRPRLLGLLIDLVRVGEDEAHDARQWRSQAALCASDPGRAPLIEDLIKDPKKRHLLSTDSELRAGYAIPVITIIHESLLTGWPLLAEAIRQARPALLRRTRLIEIFSDWQASGGEQSYLLKGAYLEQARLFSQAGDIMFRDNKELRQFYERSESQARSELEQRLVEQEQRLRLRTRLNWALAILLLVALRLLFPLMQSAYYQLATGTRTATIPGGPFTFDGRTVELNAFLIERYEVSQGQYRRCVDYGPCDRPTNRSLYDNPDFDTRPMVNLSAQMAADYCAWIGRRLPTTIEWERAVHGAAERQWPWGDAELTPQRANVGTSGVGDFNKTLPVTATLELDGATPDSEGGIAHLIGNVAEFAVAPDPDCAANAAACHAAWDGESQRLVGTMGGSYKSRRSTSILQLTPIDQQLTSELYGFRCADDP